MSDVEGAEASALVTDEERYQFDLQGYLVVRGVLSPEELGELNQLIDEKAVDPATLDEPLGEHTSMLHWGKPFWDLLDHPRILPYLKELVDPEVRADLCFATTMAKGSRGGTPHLHMGGTPYNPLASYHFRDGRPFGGLTVVSWTLTDNPPGKGGFACIPGSHKANYPCPESIRTNFEPGPVLHHVPAAVGDAVIFTEALTHGTLPWENDFVRRVLFYRYTPGHMRFLHRAGTRIDPMNSSEVLDLMTPRQRQLLTDGLSEHEEEADDMEDIFA